jgi:hypothetical protein
MAAANPTIASPLGSSVLAEDSASTATPFALRTAATTIRLVRIDNSDGGVDVYTKLYNVAVGSVTVGTTVPDMTIWAQAGEIRLLAIPEGVAFGTAVTSATVRTGGTGGDDDPDSTVSVSLYA